MWPLSCHTCLQRLAQADCDGYTDRMHPAHEKEAATWQGHGLRIPPVKQPQEEHGERYPEPPT